MIPDTIVTLIAILIIVYPIQLLFLFVILLASNTTGDNTFKSKVNFFKHFIPFWFLVTTTKSIIKAVKKIGWTEEFENEFINRKAHQYKLKKFGTNSDMRIVDAFIAGTKCK